MRREKDGGIVFERRAVVVGGSGAWGIEVAPGLRPGDTVVLDSPAGLADGGRVKRR